MNGIVGVAQLPEAADLGDEERELLDILRTCSDSQMALIQDILTFSALEFGSARLDAQPVDLGPAMRNATAFATFAAAEKDLTLDLTVPDPGCVTFADAKRLRQVVVNLVANALKFTQVGGVGALAACPEASDQESGRFRIAVTDTDWGIPEAEQERIHERFTQVDDPVTRQFGGVGLGLAISRSIVEEMGGEITVESRLGQGTTFRVEAPVRLGQMRDLSQI